MLDSRVSIGRANRLLRVPYMQLQTLASSLFPMSYAFYFLLPGHDNSISIKLLGLVAQRLPWSTIVRQHIHLQ